MSVYGGMYVRSGGVCVGVSEDVCERVCVFVCECVRGMWEGGCVQYKCVRES